MSISGKAGPLGRFDEKGPLNKHDQGQLQIAIAIDPEHRKILMDFGVAVAWIGLDSKHARRIADLLNEKADKLDKL
jgi:hypothetical protein